MLVSAASPEVLWARVSAQGISYLLQSTDGGATLTPVLETADVLVGAEGSADGRTVWASTPVHLYRGTAEAPLTALALPNGNACALRVGDVLYGCGSSWVHDWALARSRDEGTTWEPLLNLNGIQGAHLCPAGTPVREACPSRWPQLARLLGASPSVDGEGGSPPDAGAPAPQPSEPRPQQSGCATSTGLAPFALLLLSLSLSRRSPRRPCRRRVRRDAS